MLILSPLGLALEERFGLAWLFWVRGAVEPPSSVAVVSLDRHSAEQLGLPPDIHDWPRGIHARLIERLTEAGASVIVFDVMFTKPRDATQDEILARAVAAAGRVVLFESLAPLQREMRALPQLRVETEQLIPPLPMLAEAAAGVAPFPLPQTADRVSQFWAFKLRADAQMLPTMPVVALQQHALAVLPLWRDALEASGVATAKAWSVELGPPARAAKLRELMVSIRQTFLDDPGLHRRLADHLNNADNESKQRTLLLALHALDSGPNSRYLNFYGPAGQVPTIPLRDLLSKTPSGPAIEADQLAGKAVFVGQSDPLNPDKVEGFTTVFSADGVDISGVEIAATAFANLLDGRTIQPAGPWLGLGLVAAFGLVAGTIARCLPAPFAIPLALAVGGAYFGGAQLAFTGRQLWLPVAVPLLVQLPLGLFAGLFAQYREAHRARANISRAMRYYLPEKVAAGLTEAPLDPGAMTERVYAACMVTDAQGFTTLAERMTPDELTGFLDDYLETLFTPARHLGGVVTDVVGDGMTCVFTAPQPERECRVRACRAALAIERAVAAFNRRHAPRALPTRIGLNAGWVRVGNVGGGGRFVYSVVGDAVNTASRIEQLNKQLGTRLLATDTVVGDLGEFESRPLGRFRLVGKQEALAMVELLGPAGGGDRGAWLDRFAEALAVFETQRWAEAAAAFETVLAGRPDDGPSLFYLEHCRHYLAGAPAPPDPGVIRLERK
jgi:adenylate cyclase